MDYEQKYKKALGWMRSIYPTMQGAEKEDAEHYFPELRESEDEKIRKAIICGMNALKEQHKETFASIPINDCIAWLEKQGDKVDVLDDFPTEFERQISHLIASSINKEWEYKKDFVKHTANALLQYAKNELEKQGEQKPIDYNEELKKCRENPLYFFDKYVKTKEQKPAWSEEDEKHINLILRVLDIQQRWNGTTGKKFNPYQGEIDWLKSIKPNRWKPSEEQMKALNAINIFGELSYVGQGGTLVKLYNDLKKL